MVDYVGVLADLKARRDVLSEELRDIDVLIDGVERMVTRFGKYPVQASLIATQDDNTIRATATTVNKMTMPEAVKAHLKSARNWQTTKQVTDGVIALGVKDTGNLRSHVYNTLYRLSFDGGPITHGEDGSWALDSWLAEERASRG